jgi:hypothetical protein
MSNQLITGLLLFLLALLISTGIAYVLDRIKYKNIEDRLDLVWDYLIKRAETEFILKGLGTINSPYLITDEVRSWYAPIAKDLKNFYNKVGINLTNRELFTMIDKEFGEWIKINVCIPHGLEAGSCILAAIAVAKEVI